MSNNWSLPTSPDEAARRAGGRRHYNRWRQTLALIRQTKVSRLLRRYPLFKRGTVRAIARELGVNPSTICRDIKALLRLGPPCPHCGSSPIVGPDPDLFEDEEDLGPSANEPPATEPASESAPPVDRLGGIHLATRTERTVDELELEGQPCRANGSGSPAAAADGPEA